MQCQFTARLRNARGWRRNLAAYLCGATATLTLSPFFAFPLIIPAFAGLYILLENAPTKRRMFWDGWFWGWGYYMCGLYWFCIALLTDAEAFAWLIPFALFGLTGVIAMYSGLACLIFHHAQKRLSGQGALFAFALIWTLVELARGHLFTGFPWNLPGYSFGFSEPSLQLASVFGPYGLTFCVVLLGISPCFARFGKSGKTTTAGIWLLFAAGLAWGSLRIPATAQPTFPGISLRLIQANISQPHKWDPQLQLQGMREHIRLMQQEGIEKITHIIWPETAVPYVLQENSELARALGNALPPGKILLTGSLRSDGTDFKTMNLWNSLMAIDHEGKLIGSYDKAHLVPFGEFQPFRPYLPKEWMTPVGEKDFAWGTASQVLNWAGLPPMLPLICYEAIFPEMAQGQINEKGARPAWLLNVTNDAWFGLSTGPHQHFEMSRMRAVEQGVALVRVANTGISAVVDPYGRITATLPLGSQGILDAPLPTPLDTPTLYSAWHSLLLPLLTLGLIFVLFFMRKPQPVHVDFASKL